MLAKRVKSLTGSVICLLAGAIFIVAGSSCSSLKSLFEFNNFIVLSTESQEGVIQSEVRYEQQAFVELPLEDRLNMQPNIGEASLYKSPLDADSIEMFAYGGKEYYHPVYLSQRGFEFLAAYWSTKDTTFLNRAEKNANKLIEVAVNDGHLSWLPYEFDFAVHDDSVLLLKAPWYSGMAQGEALSLFARLYEITQKARYLNFAEQLFGTLIFVRHEGASPWVSRTDSRGYFWIEEYPHEMQPGMTLNGYVSATSGIYDYYTITHQDTARLVWDVCLTTFKQYIPEYRREGQPSYYCLGHKIPAGVHYHNFHVELFEWLFKATGDKFFEETAVQFGSDYPHDKL